MSSCKKNQNMPLLMMAYFISSAGNWIFKFATPLYIFTATSSAQLMALAYAAQFLPVVLFSLFVGYVSERFDNKKLLLLMDFIGFVLCLALFSLWNDEMPSELYILYSFLIASITTSYHSFFHGAIPRAFTSKQIHSVSGGIAFIDSFFPILGPMLGAVVASVISYKSALLLTGFGFLVSWFITLFIVFHDRELEKTGSLYKTIKNGFKIIIESRFLSFAILRFFMAGIGLNCFVSLFMFLLKTEYFLSDVDVGIVYAISFIGLLVGKRITSFIYNYRFDIELLLTCTGLVTALCIYLLSIRIGFVAVVVAWSVITMMSTINLIILYTERQKEVDKSNITNVVSISTMLILLSFPIGSFSASELIEFLNVFDVINISALYLLILSGIFLLSWCYSWVKRLSRQDTSEES